jgi:nucleotide-binding universal stress UspA family protein
MVTDPVLRRATMSRILCATRGGEASYRTQDAAIAMAKQEGAGLIFLFVADVSFLDQTAAPLVVDIQSRLSKMGCFQLAIAQDRAAAQGVAAEITVRKGKLRAELVAAVKELDIDVIILGHPEERHQEAIFDETALEAFAVSLQAVTGAEVRIL